ncbi:MAG: AAA-like domain-containing protein, partial [bacterium]
LAGLGTATAVEDKWYNDHMDIINEEFNLGLDLGQWIKKHEHLQSLRIFDKFIQDILLGNIEQDIVIFIDEIDTLLSLISRFSTNDYLAFIRNCYEKRNDEPAYNRLTFCLLGVASPNSLIADKNRTPFNVGTPITLSPFPTDMNNQKSHDTMKPLLDYVQLTDVLEKILHWTGGQPFLTQKLCNLWVEQHKESKSIIIKNVDEIVESMIKNWEADDNPTHFGTIRDPLIENDVKAFDRLKLYEEILENRQIDYNNSREQIELRLSGLVLEDEGQLRLYNPIYKEIFNLNWVEQEKAKLRLYIEEFDNWNEWEKWKETNNLDYDLQERYLLYGTKCDRVQQWRIKFNEDNGKLY